MKISLLLLVVVVGLSTYLVLSTSAVFEGNADPICNFWPNGDCLEAKFLSLSLLQKHQLIGLLHLDYWYLVFYSLLLGMWSYNEMQQQTTPWTNSWLRSCLLVVFILALTDITENILLGQALNHISYPFKALAFVTRLKWITLTFILLSLLISVIGRKTGLFPLSLRLKNRIE